MRRLASALLAVSVAGGCATTPSATDSHGLVTSWDRRAVREIPGLQGPYGERVPMSANAVNVPPGGIPLTTGPDGKLVPATTSSAAGHNIQQAQYTAPVQPTAGLGPLTPPANHPLFQPRPLGTGLGLGHGYKSHGTIVDGGAMPGMSGPPMMGGGGGPGMGFGGGLPRFPAQRTQVRFVRPSGMKVSWFTQLADGRTAQSPVPIDAPGRYNFPQGAIYRLKLSNIEGLPGLEVYPTIEVFPTNPKTESFLAHSAVPVEFTPEDFKQIVAGAYVVKVIYLPDPAFQDVAITGPEEILSTRLEPGVDPIQEAIRRGSILAVIRMGNVDQEAPNTPPLNSAAQPGATPNPIMNFGPTTMPPNPGSMVPFGPMGAPPGAFPPGAISAPPPGAIPPGAIPFGANPPTPTAPQPLPPAIATQPPTPTIPSMPTVPATPASRGPSGIPPAPATGPSLR